MESIALDLRKEKKINQISLTHARGGGEKMQLDPSEIAMQKNAKKNARKCKKVQKSATSKEIPL